MRHDPSRDLPPVPPVHPDCDADTAVGFAWVLAALIGGGALWALAIAVWRFLAAHLL